MAISFSGSADLKSKSLKINRFVQSGNNLECVNNKGMQKTSSLEATYHNKEINK